MEKKFDYLHTNCLIYVPEIYHHCRLDNFDYTGQPKNLHKLLQGFVEGDVSGLYFCGGFGCGKTHLLVGLYRVMVARIDEVTPEQMCFSTFDGIIEDIKGGMAQVDVVDFLVGCEVLFLDDITVVQNKEDVEILRKIINGRYESKGRTTITANSNFQDLASMGLHPHAISRLSGMCDVVEIAGKDRRRKK